MSGDHNQYQKPDYVDRRQWKYDPVTGEPVAKYSDIVSDGGLDPRRKFDVAPQREWQGLTDEEIKATWSQIWYDLGNGKFAASDDPSRHTTVMFARAIEAKLKEKNSA